MTKIQLHNTKTRKKEAFTPLDPENVRMYVCGPTVYDRAHLGNARPVVVFDVLYRLLRHVYGEGAVTYARNFTDVDDKINARALANVGPDGGVTAEIAKITEKTIQWFLEDMGALGALEPGMMPRATEFIPQMVAMIEDLIAKGHAYAAEGHVLFAVESYSKYGALSGRSIDDMIAGARVEVAPYKRNPMDFVLWKPSTDDLPGWDSPWGRGRPGWHIECSAMAYELLGASFDIHGGGNDLMFPHHENEIAQSCCAHPESGFAQVWMHNEMLQVEGKKMSKSLGNFFTVRDLLDGNWSGGWKVPGEVIRFVFLSTHYRKPMDWTARKADEAKETLKKWASMADSETTGVVDPDVLWALSEDLNTWEAIDRLNELCDQDKRADLTASANLLGFDLDAIAQSSWAKPYHYEMQDGSFLAEGEDYKPTVSVIGWGGISDEVRDASLDVVHRWLAYRRLKDWENADRLKCEASALGVELRASRSANGVNNGTAQLNNAVIDPAKLDALK
ncbi:cysteine--tRNA ligase [Roseovarius sp. M141]|uniref:cysteine--tRNA ligase n=1 Tax=Roseovarius sp. M141 TaxID=2583806 RepID=UPI0020CBAF5D|nr:cysteine--tRNA ligase [Roseovarius sp. M141]MCQ0091366.1 cysteine--tRNA ligase [Roseovarius sp. M141]